MTEWLAHTGEWLLQAALPDTIITRQVETRGGWFDTVTSIASGIMTLALLVLTVVLTPAAWNFRKSYKRVNQLLDRVYADINPIVAHVSTIADNVNYITTSVRVDVQEVNRTIAGANRRLREAIEVTEQRLQEFNALLRVVQEEAEDVFVSTAATVRGVQTGAAAFREETDEPEGGNGSSAIEAYDPYDPYDPEVGPDDFGDVEPGGRPAAETLSEDEEEIDGYDSTRAPDERPPGPRIRPRRPRAGSD